MDNVALVGAHARAMRTLDSVRNLYKDPDALADALDAILADARRYRWLREEPLASSLARDFRDWLRENYRLNMKALDAAIDAAIDAAPTAAQPTDGPDANERPIVDPAVFDLAHGLPPRGNDA